jgi:hypothetical protein
LGEFGGESGKVGLGKGRKERSSENKEGGDSLVYVKVPSNWFTRYATCLKEP